MKFLYGTDEHSVDVTQNVYKLCSKDDIITIPTDDVVRAKLLGDPMINVLKWFYIEHPDGTIEKYSDNVLITIENNKISTEVLIKPVIVAIAKLEQNYIKEWVDYHLLLGFDKIFLYDNEDTPVYNDLLQNNKVEVIHVLGNNYPKPVQYHCLEHFNFNFINNKNITHVLHIDIDEFVALKKHSNIKDFIKEYIVGNTAGIGMNWRHFGDNFLTESSSDPVTKRFTLCELNGNKTIKTLFNKKLSCGWRICHCIQPKENYVVRSTNGEIIDESYCTPDYSVIQLNHYKCKTKPEFLFARTRGRCDIHDTFLKTDNDDFDRFNFNETIDLTACGFYNYRFDSINEFLNFNGIVPIEGNSNQIPEQLHDLTVLSKNVKSVLEIGFNAGHSTEIFLKNKVSKVVSFDLGEHFYVKEVKNYIDYTYPGKHTLILGDSTKTIPCYPEEKFDLIFIDGGHQLEIARQDLLNCKRFAHSETILVMDDIVYRHHAPWTIGPTRAWIESKNNMVTEFMCRFYSEGRGMCWGKYK